MKAAVTVIVIPRLLMVILKTPSGTETTYAAAVRAAGSAPVTGPHQAVASASGCALSAGDGVGLGCDGAGSSENGAE